MDLFDTRQHRLTFGVTVRYDPELRLWNVAYRSDFHNGSVPQISTTDVTDETILGAVEAACEALQAALMASPAHAHVTFKRSLKRA